jgi:AsmA protein
MRKILVGVAVLLVVLVAAAVAIPFFVPASTYETRIAAAVKSATGRDLVIGGPVSFSLLPSVALKAQNVALSDVSGSSAPMASLGELDVGLRLLPLLSGDVEIDRLTLSHPVIHLSVDRSGRGNWAFGGTPGSPQTALATAPSTPSPQSASSAQSLRQLHLGTQGQARIRS